ncbi:MAG: hypothetical protein K6T85_00785 [Gorillibacterium sp.]|nr:hypothetical protein [Gorillibacterium sp.]
MAQQIQVKKTNGKCKRAWRMPSAALAILLLTLIVMPSLTYAAVPTPHLEVSSWRTGEIDVTFSDVVPGNMITLYITTYDKHGSFDAHDVWIADVSEGYHISKYFENGQSVWFYITQYNPVTGETSSASNTLVSTPPITAYIINWPEMFSDFKSLFDGLSDVIRSTNQSMQDALEGLATPSEGAMDDLADAVNDLKDSLGAGSANQAGTDLQGAIDNSQSGMQAPAVVDDGEHTWTGGKTGTDLPSVEGGTATALTMKIPLHLNPDGSFHYYYFFTQEQLDKFMWLGLLRKIAVAVMWISLAIWLVVRFTPALKA